MDILQEPPDRLQELLDDLEYEAEDVSIPGLEGPPISVLTVGDLPLELLVSFAMLSLISSNSICLPLSSQPQRFQYHIPTSSSPLSYLQHRHRDHLLVNRQF